MGPARGHAPAMVALLVASILWSLSFGFIKTQLANLDSTWVAWVRLGLSLLAFLPWFRPRGLSLRASLAIALTGAIQYGAMYVTYLASFRFLAASEVVVFTVTTPVFVALLGDAFDRRVVWYHVAAAILSLLMAGWLVYRSPEGRSILLGFGLVQLSNLCFAIGQIAYRHVMRPLAHKRDHEVFALAFGGAVALVSLAVPMSPQWGALNLSWTQIAVLLYLGLIPSALAFFLWNAGARKVSTGVLAVMNNAKVPLGVVASLVLFERGAPLAQWARIALASLGMTAAIVASELLDRAALVRRHT